MHSAEDERLRHLRATRPRQPFLWWSLAGLAALVAASWIFGGFQARDLLSEQRQANLARFLREARPWPLSQGEPWSGLWAWMGHLLQSDGWLALWRTVWLSIAGIVLAGLAAFLAMPWAARSLARPHAFEEGQSWLWRGRWLISKAALLLARSIPEYLVAFLLLAMLGPTPWVLVLALAIHNAGILGRLGAEVVDHLPPTVPRAMQSAGASRQAIFALGIAPLALPRWLAFLFYRWETCVRDATVLGMLGFLSLGHLILEARVRQRYDEMVFFVLLGALIVWLGDLASSSVRRWLRGQ